MVKHPKIYDRVWAFNAKHIAVEYEIMEMHNGILRLRHKQGHRTLSKEHVFDSIENLCLDVISYSHPLPK